nr:hypothetical protein [Escherichia coli]
MSAHVPQEGIPGYGQMEIQNRPCCSCPSPQAQRQVIRRTFRSKLSSTH